MTQSGEPKKEAVRIKVSPSGSSLESAGPARSGVTARIHLPSRPASNPEPPDPPSPVRTATAAAPAPMTAPGPKKEIARITMLADPPAKPAVEMKKTQPVIDLPQAEKPATRIIVTSQPQPESISTIDKIPMPLCWVLLGASAVILILQIWNYLS